MLDIMRVFACLSQRLSTTALRQLTRVTEALLSMSSRVTMRGLSRWADQGGSYRTVQQWRSRGGGQSG
jgi:putative transposase